MADDKDIGQDDLEQPDQHPQGAATPPQEPPPKADSPQKDAGTDIALDQSEIEALMRDGESSGPAAPASTSANTPVTNQPAPGTAAQDGSPQFSPHSDVEVLLNQAQQALASIDGGINELPPRAAAFEFKDFVGTPPSKDIATLELMRDVELDLKIELGRTHMQLEDVLRLQTGAVVSLDKLAGDPVDIYVNGRLIARGEVLVLNDNFCVRVAELIVGEGACA